MLWAVGGARRLFDQAPAAPGVEPSKETTPQKGFQKSALNLYSAQFLYISSRLFSGWSHPTYPRLRNHRRLLSTYNWVSVCIYRQIPPFQICETQRKARWTKRMCVNSQMSHLCQARSCCWCGSLAEDISVGPRTRFHTPSGAATRRAQRPPVSGSGRAYCSTISLRVTILQGCQRRNKLRQMAPAEHQGRRLERNPFNEGSRPAAGAWKDHSRRHKYKS